MDLFGWRGRKVTVEVTQEDLVNGHGGAWDSPIRQALAHHQVTSQWQVSYQPERRKFVFEHKFRAQGEVSVPRSARRYFDSRGYWAAGPNIAPFSFQIRLPKSVEAGWKE